MRNFRELDIWKNSIQFVVVVYEIIDSFPVEEKYSLSKQIKRAVISIPSNIAEGCRGSNKELKQFLNISLGSSFELETQLEIAYKVNFLKEEVYHKLIEELNILQKRINAFRNTIR